MSRPYFIIQGESLVELNARVEESMERDSTLIPTGGPFIINPGASSHNHRWGQAMYQQRAHQS